jgi:hypothetical protein
MFDSFSRRHPSAVLGWVLAIALAAAPVADATKLEARNLTQLISESQSIIAGTVKAVTDGIDANGVPYTEVTIAVSSSAKGGHADHSEYTFRQFGLLAPRTMDNGLEYLAVSPAGFARWQEGESVVAFLYKAASLTGLQTTSGLAQGKLAAFNGKLVNEFGNAGLFEGVEVAEGLLSAEESAMLASTGPVDAQTFMNLVSRAVAEGWIENGEMR